MTPFVGTSGYSYKQWKGSFYPADIAADQMLAYYARHLSCVEINNTFYRMPRSEVLERWCEQVPQDFRFAIKASRRITHQHRLRGASDNVSYLYGKLESLRDRLGAVLFQLPPQLQKDVPRLREFLDILPSQHRAVFEFRHASWFCDEVYEQLASAGAVLCAADHDPEEGIVAAPLITTARWGYLRLRRLHYAAQELSSWLEQVRAAERQWQHAYVFFMHEDPAPARHLAALATGNGPEG